MLVFSQWISDIITVSLRTKFLSNQQFSWKFQWTLLNWTEVIPVIFNASALTTVLYSVLPILQWLKQSNLSTPTSDRYLDPPHKYIPYTWCTACPECSTNIIVGYNGCNEKVSSYINGRLLFQFTYVFPHNYLAWKLIYWKNRTTNSHDSNKVWE